ncbi:type I polyketide synthase [Nostoc sp. UIC 10630]|uniref:type I polyketide synthase n=1 Tax=Nostoc sp. UIC 10630 TaxID=2100146 RepID=UPI0013D42FFF|nr:type I polyketide synthase [Nostoc sp. UIC 10630]NEU79518.1 acyltransferase domain-containing protein [Nostoc sp. UIC 10630]QID92161.1 polyketide synthase [Nostoc sp. UIC 10630]
MEKFERSDSQEAIAIIGMSGRFPGAKNVEEFWYNLRNGVESITFFSQEELESVGIAKEVVRHSQYVKANGIIDNIEWFDAAFFGMNPTEAEITDPQQRLFLECAWEALEQAGYEPETYFASIGVYAGTGGFNTYFLNNLYANPELRKSVGDYQMMIANDSNLLSTRVSYKLNLTGPSVTIQTACSTSLVAISMACRSLLNYECDLALAGGVSVRVPQKTGYFYQEGMIASPDGHCRAFDAKAQGTVGGSGVGIVVLKRLEEAIADRDYIHAVVKGCGINNDGAKKVGLTAPSVDGQAAVISQALAFAEVESESITYIEAHGTATPMGDPIEIAALTQVFSHYTQKKSFCALGSVKTNIGHLDSAAGVAGLIKTVCALKHKLIPPSLHFEEPSPEIDFANSPFYVNTKLSEWNTQGTPRRAGVSSFGVGGTNAHVILEEAPVVQTSGQSRPWQLLMLSAKTDSALESATVNLVEHLKEHPKLNLADVAYTLSRGRKAFDYRRILVCRTQEDVIAALSTNESQRVLTNFQESIKRRVVFMFSGQGAQYVNMALELYQVEPTFRHHIDVGTQILKPYLGLDLRQILYPQKHHFEEATEQLKQTALTQPALFIIEYALAQLWMSWGIHPQAMIGHSIGEYVAACLAGVFSLEDALSLVAKRGQLMQQLPPGAMLAVPLEEKQLQPLLGEQLSLALINGPANCVVAGTTEAVETLQLKLMAQGVECRHLHTSHAFHSYMMEPILVPFTLAVKNTNLKPPQIPYLSNVTGTWITAEQATNPNYWAQHLRHEVRFADGLQQLLKQPEQILLEIGSGRILTTLVKQNPEKAPEQIVLSSLRHPQDEHSDVAFLLTTLGKLWLAGVQVNWSEFFAHEQRQRLPLPTYPFERQPYWIDAPGIPQPTQFSSLQNTELTQKREPIHLRPNLHNAYVAPTNEVQQSLAEIWQQFLGIGDIGIHDDFFELGGDSLQAVQLLSQLSQTFQKSLSPHSLLQAPTIAALAQLIQQTPSKSEISTHSQTKSVPSLLVEIQKGCYEQPLFLVHPVGGHVYTYRDLARCLGSDQTVYGIQSPAVDGHTEPLTKVEDIATQYIQQLRVLQPQGPYFLGGSSFGGTVAFEMAQQLHTQGLEVALLALIDTPGPGQMPVFLEEDETAILVYILSVGLNIPITVEHLQQMTSDEQLLYFLEQMKMTDAGIVPNFGLPELRHELKLFNVYVKAMRNYVPQTYSGQVVFFLATERDAYNAQSPELPWLELATSGVKIIPVPGNHITMHNLPHVQVLAEKLRLKLDEARQLIQYSGDKQEKS